MKSEYLGLILVDHLKKKLITNGNKPMIDNFLYHWLLERKKIFRKSFLPKFLTMVYWMVIPLMVYPWKYEKNKFSGKKTRKRNLGIDLYHIYNWYKSALFAYIKVLFPRKFTPKNLPIFDKLDKLYLEFLDTRAEKYTRAARYYRWKTYNIWKCVKRYRYKKIFFEIWKNRYRWNYQTLVKAEEFFYGSFDVYAPKFYIFETTFYNYNKHYYITKKIFLKKKIPKLYSKRKCKKFNVKRSFRTIRRRFNKRYRHY